MRSAYEKIQEAAGLLGVVIAGVVLALVMVAMAGCAHDRPPPTKLIKRACGAPEILTYTTEDWSETDQRAYDTAARRCQELYPRSPCMKKFIRYAQTRYGVVCGAADDAELN